MEDIDPSTSIVILNVNERNTPKVFSHDFSTVLLKWNGRFLGKENTGDKNSQRHQKEEYMNEFKKRNERLVHKILLRKTEQISIHRETFWVMD